MMRVTGGCMAKLQLIMNLFVNDCLIAAASVLACGHHAKLYVRLIKLAT